MVFFYIFFAILESNTLNQYVDCGAMFFMFNELNSLGSISALDQNKFSGSIYALDQNKFSSSIYALDQNNFSRLYKYICS